MVSFPLSIDKSSLSSKETQKSSFALDKQLFQAVSGCIIFCLVPPIHEQTTTTSIVPEKTIAMKSTNSLKLPNVGKLKKRQKKILSVVLDANLLPKRDLSIDDYGVWVQAMVGAIEGSEAADELVDELFQTEKPIKKRKIGSDQSVMMV